MIYKLLLNINNFITYFVALFIVCLLIYVIYKIFILENDLYVINDKLAKIELEYSGNTEVIYGNNNNHQLQSQKGRNYDINMNEIIMNTVFSDNNPIGTTSIEPTNISEVDIIDIDKMILKEDPVEILENTSQIFDLKKEVINDDKESIISTNANTKKKLLKLNLDRLKEKCTDYELSTDGTKAQLIERILEKEQQLEGQK